MSTECDDSGQTVGVTPASFSSAPVQELRRLLARRRDRHASRAFVVEGPVLLAEAVRAGWGIRTQFVPADRPETGLDGAGDVVVVSPDVLDRLGSTRSPQPPVAVVEMPAPSNGAYQLGSGSKQVSIL